MSKPAGELWETIWIRTLRVLLCGLHAQTAAKFLGQLGFVLCPQAPSAAHVPLCRARASGQEVTLRQQ